MENKINHAIVKIESLWEDLDINSLREIKSSLQQLALTPEVQFNLGKVTEDSAKGVELHRNHRGFIILAYAEDKGTYRVPHNHGDAWVVYVVVEGEVEMRNYFKFNGGSKDRLILKNREKLVQGEVRIYYPGEIHDTRCLSNRAVILRFTSRDLRDEERDGRMHRFGDLL